MGGEAELSITLEVRVEGDRVWKREALEARGRGEGRLGMRREVEGERGMGGGAARWETTTAWRVRRGSRGAMRDEEEEGGRGARGAGGSRLRDRGPSGEQRVRARESGEVRGGG